MNIRNEKELETKHFRVAIFGSARIEKGHTVHESVFKLAKLISAAGIDLVTGGGSGLMNAASEGHHAGRSEDETHSIGLKIKLPIEDQEAMHLDIKKEFHRFSHRLDTFMQLSNAVVVASGGVGTLLELFYTWQLLQVKQISNIPIILLGDMWFDLVEWIKRWPLKHKLLDKKDVQLLFLAKNCYKAFEIIKQAHKDYQKNSKY